MGTSWETGYSSKVDIYLLVDGQRLGVAQVGPDTFFLSKPAEIPAGIQATIVIEVDGREDRHLVLLYEGASLDQPGPIRFFEAQKSGS